MRLLPRRDARLVPAHAVPRAQLDRMLELDPVSSVFVAEHVRQLREAPSRMAIPVVGVAPGRRPRPGARGQQLELSGACWVGSNVVPVHLDDDGIRVVADHLVSARTGRASIFGPQAEVLGLWEALRGRWQDPFDVRPDQPLMIADRAPAITPHPEVRLAQVADLRAVQPASAAMFEEEVGFSPYIEGRESYDRRVHQLILRRRTFVLMRDGAVVFKADIGAASETVCQIQGVWVRPQDRGQGLAAPCMAAVVQAALQRYDVVSLYVNDYNAAAIRTYLRAGFRQRGSFATVLF